MFKSSNVPRVETAALLRETVKLFNLQTTVCGSSTPLDTGYYNDYLHS